MNFRHGNFNSYAFYFSYTTNVLFDVHLSRICVNLCGSFVLRNPEIKQFFLKVLIEIFAASRYFFSLNCGKMKKLY